MALSYDQRKKSYDSMNDSQKQQYNDLLKNEKDDYIGNQYMKQYNQANQQTNSSSPLPEMPTEMSVPSWEEQKPLNQQTPTVQKTENQTNAQVSPDLDQSKFNQAPWQITVKEWTAQQTGKPDYQISTDARLNEMKSNLDQYFATSPRMFSDRQTFNKVFEYNNRESEAQRQLLDSYRKRKEDMDKASQYTSWEAINNWLKNAEITTDQLNLIKEYDPEAYKQWQELQEEQIKLRIVNDIVPPLMEDIASQINDMINRLWIQAQEALDIEWIYNDTMDRLWAYQTLEDANRTVKQIEEITNKKTAIMNRYAASTWWTVSDALAAARMAKAIAPYNEQLQWLQYQYQDYYNLYSQKTATATQAANVRAMQAQENQRIWTQKCQALWFAMDVMSYRTPEQQAQLRLQEQQAKNEMQLLQQSRLNDLNRYNAYATAKLNNQLQQELTDLSVEDETQLKANLNNALSDYYKNYGDIIQRSQAQAVEDIIAYAKKHGISVAQAMTESFIKPLQNKKEYKQMIATNYGMLSKNSWVSTFKIWDTEFIDYNGQLYTAEEFNKQFWGKTSSKAYNSVSSEAMSTWLNNFLDNLSKYNGKGWQCAKFVNDYLEEIWVGKYFGTEDAKTRAGFSNTDSPTIWSIAIFDYNQKSDDWKNYGHVGIVTDITQSGDLIILDSNFGRDGKIQFRTVNPSSASLKWFFDPTIPYGWANVENWTEIENWTQTSTSTITDSDIISFNDKTLNRKLSDEDRQRIAEARNKVYSDPNASIEDILRFSQWWDSVTDATVQSFDKYGQALTSLWQLTDLLEDTNTWPILWALRSKNPYDKKAREIETAIAWLLPTLARWVYGEVWVLTDKDIEHYSKTVPNLKSTSDVNEAILAMSLDMLANGYKRKLQNQAALWKDVSGMAWVYYQIVNESDRIKKKIWIDWTQSTTTTPEKWISSLPKASDVFKVNTNVWWSDVPSNFY